MKAFDESGAFRPEVEGQGVRRLAVRGAGVTLLSGGVGFAVQMIATVILARLLAPADFGLVAMVTTFSLLLINFGLNGFTEAVLQREKIDDRLISNLFWINAGGGLVLALTFAASGPLLGKVYGDARVARVAVVMSLAIFISGVSVEHLALLKRAMRFPLVSANDIVARAVSVAVSILLAWAGWGYWALVAGAIALPASTSIGAWWLCRWTPTLPQRRSGTADMVRFGLSTYGRFIANYCTWNLDNLLVGWRFGPVSLGFYKKAYDLFALPASALVSPLTSVAVSALSRLQRESLQYRRYLLGALGATAFVGLGLGADLTLVGRDVIRLLLGPKWDEAGRIFMFFGPGIGIMLVYYTHGWIHLSIGRADRWLRWGFVEFTVTALFLVLGLSWGPVGIAIAWTVSFWVLTVPAFWYAGKPIHLSVGPIVAVVWRYVVASVLAGSASAVVLRGLPLFTGAPDAVAAAGRIAVTSTVFALFYISAVVLLHGGLAPVYQIFRLLLEMLPGARSDRPSPTPAGAGELVS